MKTWNIPVSYIVAGSIQIEAKTLAEAIDKAWEDGHPLPSDSEYIMDSWEVDDQDLEVVRRWNNNGQEDET